MARPKQAEHNRRALIILLLEEIQIIQRNAYIVGLSVSEYMRRCSLNNRLHSRINDEAINCVNSLCGLHKHLLIQISNHTHEDELRHTLTPILAVISETSEPKLQLRRIGNGRNTDQLSKELGKYLLNTLQLLTIEFDSVAGVIRKKWTDSYSR
jgi:hypothetical protein